MARGQSLSPRPPEQRSGDKFSLRSLDITISVPEHGSTIKLFIPPSDQAHQCIPNDFTVSARKPQEANQIALANGQLKNRWFASTDGFIIIRAYCYNLILRWNPQVEEYFIKAYGADHFSRISNALTHPSCYSCIRVNTLKSTSDAVIEKLSTIIAAGPISKCQVPGLEDYVLFVTGSGPHSIDYGYTTSPPKEVIVSRKCAEAVLRGAQFCKRRLWTYGH